jgi:hypothetical protein
MAWVRLDDGFTEHPKVVEAGPMAAWLYVCGLTYCARNLTDGVLPNAQITRLLPTRSVHALAQKLVDVGLWETTPGGFRVHDYLIYNASREQTLALRQQKAEAGRKGGWQKASNVLAERQASGTTPVPKPQPVPIAAATRTEYLQQQDTSALDMLSPPAAADRAPRRAKKSLEPAYSDEFEAFWAVYPRHREKVDAFKAYSATLKAGATVESVLTAATHYAAYCDAEGTEEHFIKLPATFLGPSRPWLDFRTGRPQPTNGAGQERYFPDYRSPAEKAVNPTRAWRQTWAPATEERT